MSEIQKREGAWRSASTSASFRTHQPLSPVRDSNETDVVLKTTGMPHSELMLFTPSFISGSQNTILQSPSLWNAEGNCGSIELRMTSEQTTVT